jgi:two-component system NarL family sensor kinase
MLEEKGLQSAMEWYVEGFAKRSGIKTKFELHDGFRLAPEAEVAMFRVLQEALTNVHRYSESEVAYVRLSRSDGVVVLEVEDKGKGIPARILEAPTAERIELLGVGLRGMKERIVQLGGKLELASNGQGATVRAIVPISHPPIEPT